METPKPDHLTILSKGITSLALLLLGMLLAIAGFHSVMDKSFETILDLVLKSTAVLSLALVFVAFVSKTAQQMYRVACKPEVIQWLLDSRKDPVKLGSLLAGDPNLKGLPQLIMSTIMFCSSVALLLALSGISVALATVKVGVQQKEAMVQQNAIMESQNRMLVRQDLMNLSDLLDREFEANKDQAFVDEALVARLRYLSGLYQGEERELFIQALTPYCFSQRSGASLAAALTLEELGRAPNDWFIQDCVFTHPGQDKFLKRALSSTHKSNWRSVRVEGLTLSGLTLAGQKFSDVTFQNVKFYDCDFTDVVLENVNFVACEFERVDLRKLCLEGELQQQECIFKEVLFDQEVGSALKLAPKQDLASIVDERGER